MSLETSSDKGIFNSSISRYEITSVYSHPEAQVDIVIVHGLNGSPKSTWTSRNGVFWPTDLLPDALRSAHANILVYGYNADVYSSPLVSRHHDCQGVDSSSPSTNFIHQHAQTLVANLALFRHAEGRTRRPLLWVCHSLGGILVKQALLYSADLRASTLSSHQDEMMFRSLYVSTFGIILLGTPHTGADAASWGLMLQGMAGMIMPRRLFATESVLLRTLRRDNETLASINSRFLNIYHRFRIHMVHENHKTNVMGTSVLVVDPISASPPLPGVVYYGVEATHSDLCKFSSPEAPGFRAVSSALRQWVVDSPALIRGRWALEDQQVKLRMTSEIQERIRPFLEYSKMRRFDEEK